MRNVQRLGEHQVFAMHRVHSGQRQRGIGSGCEHEREGVQREVLIFHRVEAGDLNNVGACDGRVGRAKPRSICAERNEFVDACACCSGVRLHPLGGCRRGGG